MRSSRRPRPRLGLQTTIQPGRVREVERVGVEEARTLPADAIWRTVRALYRHGLHPAIALHVRHRGRVVLDRTIGHVDFPPGGPPGPIATPDTLFNLFSASKIVTASLVHALVDDGLIALSTPVDHYLPGFGAYGKDAITIRHLLSHTAGIPDMPHGPDAPDFAAMLRRGDLDLSSLYAMRPRTPAGVDVAYHPMTAWFLLGAVIQAVTGRGLRETLRARLLDPMGLATLDYGVPASALGDVARHHVTGPPVPGFMDRIFKRSVGLDFRDAIRLTNEPAFLTAALPSANVIGTPRDTTAFMQMLLDGGVWRGTRVLSPAAVHRLTTPATPVQRDTTLTFPMSYGQGVMMGGDAFSLYGFGTRGAFGHLGLSTVVVYADPRRELAVAFLNTGKPMMAHGMLTWYAVLQQIALAVPRTR